MYNVYPGNLGDVPHGEVQIVIGKKIVVVFF
jgi:hypothetical protein